MTTWGIHSQRQMYMGTDTTIPSISLNVQLRPCCMPLRAGSTRAGTPSRDREPPRASTLGDLVMLYILPSRVNPFEPGLFDYEVLMVPHISLVSQIKLE